jgi:hypothetical protein
MGWCGWSDDLNTKTVVAALRDYHSVRSSYTQPHINGMRRADQPNNKKKKEKEKEKYKIRDGPGDCR